jgi:phenylacetate-CoA ligase
VRVLERARGTLTILRTLPGQRRVPYLPPERVAELRDTRVREIVAHATETVPYYRDLFARERIDPREIRSASDLSKLPLIDNPLVCRDYERFRSQSRAGKEAIRFRSTGTSTGVPLHVFHDRDSLLANVAYSERERAVEALLCGKRYRYAVVDIRFGPATVKRVRAFYDASTFRPLRPQHHQLAIETPLDQVIATINRLRPDVIRSYGTYLETFFRIVAERGLELQLPKVLVYAGDGMTREGRALVEQRFGVPAISHYNAVEAFKIGHFCEARDGFHLHDDLCHVDVVDKDGRPVPVGETGELVISNLVNRGTVLLNYRIGDLGRMTAEPCVCGRTSRRLIDLEGRVAEVVHLPNGNIVHQYAVAGVFRRFQGVVRYQLVQHRPDRFELRVMTVDHAAFEQISPDLEQSFRELLQGASLEITRENPLEIDRQGKFQRVVSLVRAQ